VIYLGTTNGFAAYYVDEKSDTVIVSLGPGDKIAESLEIICKELDIRTGVITSGIGSFSEVFYQYGGKDITDTDKKEMLTLSGIIADYKPHLHVSMIGFDGTVTGGHFYEGTIYTVAEIAIQKLSVKLKRDLRDGCELPLICEIE